MKKYIQKKKKRGGKNKSSLPSGPIKKDQSNTKFNHRMRTPTIMYKANHGLTYPRYVRLLFAFDSIIFAIVVQSHLALPGMFAVRILSM